MDKILPLNITAQLAHRVRGNPPSAHLETSVANCFPGLEFDLRGIWAKLFEEIVLHEQSNNVIHVDSNAPLAIQNQEGILLLEVVYNNRKNSISYPLGSAMERGNAVADLLQHGGDTVSCKFLPLRKFSQVSSSSILEDSDSFPEFGADADIASAWISAARSTADSEEIIEWDFGDLHHLKILRLYRGEGILSNLLPEAYTFLHRRKADDEWQPFLTQEDAEEDEGGWFKYNLTPFATRFVQLKMPKLRSFRGDFLVAIRDVQFDPFIEDVHLTIQSFFPNTSPPTGSTEVVKSPALDPKALESGELTQSLCSPWQHDYRDCVCFYWAASRPDFVNVDPETGNGHNWTDLEREVDESGQPVYNTRTRADDSEDPILIEYEQLFEGWEKKDTLKFQFEGKDEV